MLDPRSLGVYVVTSGGVRSRPRPPRASRERRSRAAPRRSSSARPSSTTTMLLPLATDLASGAATPSVLFVVNDRRRRGARRAAPTACTSVRTTTRTARAAARSGPRARASASAARTRRRRRSAPAPTTSASRSGPPPTKPEAVPLGLEGVRDVVRGDDAPRRRDRRHRRRRTQRSVLEAGAAGVAVISAVAAAADPVAAARTLAACRRAVRRRSEDAWRMTEQRTGKATAELFEQVILRRLGAPDADVLVGPRHGVDVGVVRGRRRRRDGRHHRPGVRRARVRMGARRVVRRAHPGVGRLDERAAAAMDGGRPQPAARDLRRGSDVALGRVLADVRRPGHRGRDRPHGALRRLRVADGGRRDMHGARPVRCVRHADDGAPGRPSRRHEGRGDRGDGAVRGDVPRAARGGRRRATSCGAPTPCSSG